MNMSVSPYLYYLPVIAGGYWVPKVGSNDTSFEEIMGRHDLSTMNENADIFAKLCQHVLRH